MEGVFLRPLSDSLAYAVVVHHPVTEVNIWVFDDHRLHSFSSFIEAFFHRVNMHI